MNAFRPAGAAAGFALALALAGPAKAQSSLAADLDACEAGAHGDLAAGLAINACERAAEAAETTDRVRAQILINLGVLRLQAGQGRLALAHFETAAALAPDLPVARLNAAAAAIETGVYDRALRHAQSALDTGLAPAHWAWFNMGLAHEGMGRRQEAYAAYGRAAALAPGEPILAAQAERLRPDAP